MMVLNQISILLTDILYLLYAIKKKRSKYIPIFIELLRKDYSPDLNEAIIMQAQSAGGAFVKKVIEGAPDIMNEELTGYVNKKRQ